MPYNEVMVSKPVSQSFITVVGSILIRIPVMMAFYQIKLRSVNTIAFLPWIIGLQVSLKYHGC